MIRPEVAESIAAIAWYIESKGMLTTAERFSDDVYDYIQNWHAMKKIIKYAGSLSEYLWATNVSLIKRNIQLYL